MSSAAEKIVDLERPKLLQWTDDHVRRFWDYWSHNEAMQGSYFSKQVGLGITNLLEMKTPLSGKQILDFGAGPGYLVEHLLNAGAIVSATEHSPESVKVLDQKFADRENWRGCAIVGDQEVALGDRSFDIICCLETIEHLSDPALEFVFSEIHRLLKPGGFALFTTPNHEPLQNQTVFCPNCSHAFHRWQHMRSWNSESLKDSLEHFGYSASFCMPFDIEAFQPRPKKSWKDTTFREARSRYRFSWRQFKDRLMPRPFPNQRTFKYLVGSGQPNNLIAFASRQSPAVLSE